LAGNFCGPGLLAIWPSSYLRVGDVLPLPKQK
jgi:hypothetical protein